MIIIHEERASDPPFVERIWHSHSEGVEAYYTYLCTFTEESAKFQQFHVQMYTYEMSLEEISIKGVLSMRKVIAALFITLDGVVESPDKWQEHFDEDMGQAMMEQLASQDAVLLGRVTYQEWASYWPNATDEPFASFINSTPKYVFSTTLESVEAWQNSTLVKGDLAQEIARLKQQLGKNIGTAGNPTLVRSLLEQDLLDELVLLVHPVVAGSGKRLFKDGEGLKRLNLLSAKPTRTGTVILTYQPRKA